jgi:hypothetical protein
MVADLCQKPVPEGRQISRSYIKRRIARALLPCATSGTIFRRTRWASSSPSIAACRAALTCQTTRNVAPCLASNIKLARQNTTQDVADRRRALIGLMVYSFARIGTAITMAAEDIYTQIHWHSLQLLGNSAAAGGTLVVVISARQPNCPALFGRTGSQQPRWPG